MLMLKPIVEQWNNVIALDLFSLHDSSTGVATQWRAASSAFQDMEAMRDERITHESGTKTSISYETPSNFDTFHTLSNRFECHKVPRLPRKTTGQPAWKHSKRTCFPASTHRHGDATGKPATRDKTCGCRKLALWMQKTSISYETSYNFDIFDTLSNRLECHKVLRLPRKTT